MHSATGCQQPPEWSVLSQVDCVGLATHRTTSTDGSADVAAIARIDSGYSKFTQQVPFVTAKDTSLNIYSIQQLCELHTAWK